MKRIILIFIAVCSVFQTPSPAVATELVFWTTEIHQDRIQAISFLLEAYSVMQDDVTVKLVSVNENDLYARMKEAAAAHEVPHLVGACSELLSALCGLHVLDRDVPTRFVRKLGVDRFYAGTLREFATRDEEGWYGIPFHGWVQGLWYRSDWFREAGLAPPVNWTTILAAARHFHDPGTGRYGILIGTADDAYTEQVFTQLARSNRAAMFDGNGNVVFDNPAMVEAVKYYRQLARYTPPGPQTWRARDYFMQGKLAMMFYSTFIMDDLALAHVAQDSLSGANFKDLHGAPFDPALVREVQMVPAIRHKARVTYGMINGFGVKADLSEEDQRAVEDFLSFLYEQSHYVTWLHMAPGGMMPVVKNVATSNLFLADPSGIFRRYGRKRIRTIINGLSTIDNFGQAGKGYSQGAAAAYAEGIVARMLNRVIFSGVSPEEGVSHAAQEIRAVARSLGHLDEGE